MFTQADGASSAGTVAPRPSTGAWALAKPVDFRAMSPKRDAAIGAADRADDAVDDLEVGGGDLELVRGDPEDLLARVLGGGEHGLADRVGDRAAAADRRLRCGRRLDDVDADLIEREAERLGRDRRDRGRRAGDVGDDR